MRRHGYLPDYSLKKYWIETSGMYITSAFFIIIVNDVTSTINIIYNDIISCTNHMILALRAIDAHSLCSALI